MANNLVLPDEMIGEIVLRLPEESVLRFKSVSHQWLTRINHPTFIKSYREKIYNSKKIMIGTDGWNSTFHLFSLLHNEEETLEKVPHDFGMPRDYRIVGSCDGLLLLVHKNTLTLCVWNPFTRQYKQLPTGDNDSTSYTTSYGIGCANSLSKSSGHNYKVFQINRPEVHVYTSQANSWRRATDTKYRIRGDSCALVNAKLHFFAKGIRHEKKIVALDIADELVSEVPQPYFDACPRGMVMSELCGKLWMVCCGKGRCAIKYVWVMREYGVKESWTNMYCINLNNIIYSHYTCFKVRPLHLDIDGKILLDADFHVTKWDGGETGPEKVLMYLDSRNLEERILNLGGLPNCDFVTIYGNCLISP